MIAVGDVVEVVGHGGKWVVLGPAENAIPAERMWRVRRQDAYRLPTALTVGDGDITVLSHPTFTPNQTVRFDQAFNGQATVLADLGGVIRIRFQRQRQRLLSGERWGSVSYQFDEVDCGRGELV